MGGHMGDGANPKPRGPAEYQNTSKRRYYATIPLLRGFWRKGFASRPVRGVDVIRGRWAFGPMADHVGK